MEGQIQDGYYIWEVPGKPVVVHVKLDLVDRLAAEVMRGFGAVRKRGAEVGGLLIGTIEEGAPSLVRIDEFEAVPCEYRRGPSYLFSEDDGAAFENAYQRWRPSVTSNLYAVGYFRSHTRDGFAMAPEDVDLMDDCFPGLSNVALLIRPFGTKVSQAGFFFRENGKFLPATPLEFPLRRYELTGEEPPPRRPMNERPPRAEASAFSGPGEPYIETLTPEVHPPEKPPVPYLLARPVRSVLRNSWVWIPLSLIFLLLGVILGFQLTLTMSRSEIREYSLALAVSKVGDNLVVRWNPDAVLVRAAERGELEIVDRGFSRPVTLDRANLANGSITVQRASGNVRFRLSVFPRGGVTATESIEWRQ
jgi:hypothetical protein